MKTKIVILVFLVSAMGSLQLFSQVVEDFSKTASPMMMLEAFTEGLEAAAEGLEPVVEGLRESREVGSVQGAQEAGNNQTASLREASLSEAEVPIYTASATQARQAGDEEAAVVYDDAVQKLIKASRLFRQAADDYGTAARFHAERHQWTPIGYSNAGKSMFKSALYLKRSIKMNTANNSKLRDQCVWLAEELEAVAEQYRKFSLDQVAGKWWVTTSGPLFLQRDIDADATACNKAYEIFLSQRQRNNGITDNSQNETITINTSSSPEAKKAAALEKVELISNQLASSRITQDQKTILTWAKHSAKETAGYWQQVIDAPSLSHKEVCTMLARKSEEATELRLKGVAPLAEGKRQISLNWHSAGDTAYKSTKCLVKYSNAANDGDDVAANRYLKALKRYEAATRKYSQAAENYIAGNSTAAFLKAGVGLAIQEEADRLVPDIASMGSY